MLVPDKETIHRQPNGAINRTYRPDAMPQKEPSHITLKEGNRRPYILYLSICNVYKGLISGSYIGSVLTTDMMPAFCSLTLATASGILGVPCGTALIHPLGRRRMTPLGVESCVWAHTIHYIMHTESR